MLLPKLTPLDITPYLDVFPDVFIPLKFGFLNDGVLFGVLVAHEVTGSTLTLTWMGVFPYVPALAPLVVLSYVGHRIYSIFSTSHRSYTYSSSLANPSLSSMDLFL
jgi:hypothetical protein